ncbi:MAG: hypothetical protein IJJ69_01735, partial [Oscillospiraceae bacterium]|nr:hypothetical protein [Oscillospiraceae bacterium]
MFFKKKLTPEQQEIRNTKDFFDRIEPSVLNFYTDYYICGNSFRSVWAVTEYPPTTQETALLAHLADRNGVTLRIYNRLVYYPLLQYKIKYGIIIKRRMIEMKRIKIELSPEEDAIVYYEKTMGR